MITKKDAIKLGQAICKAVARECEAHKGQGSQSSIAARGVGIYAIDNIWYDVLPERVKADFNYDRGSFYRACGWE